MTDRHTVLLVEDHPASRFALRALLEDRFEVLETSDAREALAAEEAHRPDVVLMDLHLPDGTGVEATRTIVRRRPDARVVAMTGRAGLQECAEALSAGACGVVLKAGDAKQILEAVEAALENRSVVDPNVARVLLGSYRDLEKQSSLIAGELETQREEAAALRRRAEAVPVIAFARSLEARCAETAGHSERLALTSELVARSAGLRSEEVDHIKLGAHLHDIGKVGIPDSILWKQGPLDEWEDAQMRTHPLIGVHMLASLEIDGDVRSIVRNHHERFDGGGYPDGLRGDSISVGARIVAVADAYDAMRCRRPYRGPLSREEALWRLRAGRGRQFDSDILDVFLTLAVPEPLATGQEAV